MYAIPVTQDTQEFNAKVNGSWQEGNKLDTRD
jgi:hypothetical protein